MEGYIDIKRGRRAIANMRTGRYRYNFGEVWKVNDGPTFLGWQTIIPVRREGILSPQVSRPIPELEAKIAAQIVSMASTWEEARESIEAAFPAGFPGLKY